MSVLQTSRATLRSLRRTPVLARTHATALNREDYPVASAERKAWDRQDIQQIYDSPLMELIFKAVCLFRVQDYA